MDRQQAHKLLDLLGPAQFTAVAQLLVVLANEEGVEPLRHSLARASVEEEEITEEPPRHWIAPALHWRAERGFHTPRSCASSA